MTDYSYVFNAHSSFVESLYEKYKQDPDSVEDGWRVFFQGFEFGQQNHIDTDTNDSKTAVALGNHDHHVLSLIHGFRNRGHLLSKTNPIRTRRDRKATLDLNDYHLSEDDLQKACLTGQEIGLPNATLQQILDRLYKIYCGSIGFEYYHIPERKQRTWLRERIEQRDSESYNLDLPTKKRILEKLNGAVVFENFLHKKYIGQKRFSLEGGETTIAGLDAIINECAILGCEEIVIGMAHRGRLNVLANIMGKTYEQIFNEFEGTAVPDLSFGDGDVKYHLGYSAQVDTPSKKKIHLKLAPNPSHLESVDPVVEGFARAKGDILYKKQYGKVVPILVHGDAAFAGQGVVYETVQMSQLEGYHNGGTIHFVINNQIGFTTDFDDARTSTYCTAAANAINAPVFHVNGDDPEAVVFVCKMAAAYRQEFRRDVFIDMVCYRRHGHNEGDDPQFTQPKMYEIIKKHPNPRDIYLKQLIESGHLEKELSEQMDREFWDELQRKLDLVKEKPLPYEYQEPELAWKKLRFTNAPKDFVSSPKTSISKAKVNKIISHLMQVPADFAALKKVGRLFKNKQKFLDKKQIDWAFAELLAYGSILMEGKNVRLSGQDVERGTFSHRHAILHDVETEKSYNRLEGITDDQGEFMIYNSLLSEFAVLGFEYGYSLASPNSLVIWEAQFGDFANGAQTIFDQYIFPAESKWRRMSGLVMLLPHGYEGQGPEHSSARLERHLQSSAEFNVTVANVTTPANFFHLLRRQLARPFRKPLIVMSPKSLFRHPRCVSDISEISEGKFEEVLTEKKSPSKVKRVLLCTGKIAYDLMDFRVEHKRDDVLIIRLEQLYPFPKVQVDKILKDFAKSEFRWVQEEPSNMGSWQYVLAFYRHFEIELVSRKSSASPATGFYKVHQNEQEELIDRAFNA